MGKGYTSQAHSQSSPTLAQLHLHDCSWSQGKTAYVIPICFLMYEGMGCIIQCRMYLHVHVQCGTETIMYIYTRFMCITTEKLYSIVINPTCIQIEIHCKQTRDCDCTCRYTHICLVTSNVIKFALHTRM